MNFWWFLSIIPHNPLLSLLFYKIIGLSFNISLINLGKCCVIFYGNIITVQLNICKQTNVDTHTHIHTIKTIHTIQAVHTTTSYTGYASYTHYTGYNILYKQCILHKLYI